MRREIERVDKEARLRAREILGWDGNKGWVLEVVTNKKDGHGKAGWPDQMGRHGG